MNARAILLLVGTIALVGCGKESATSTEASDAAPMKPAMSASATASAPAPSASAPPASTVASAEAIPSQADEANAAAKEITKANYKTELATIAATLK